MPSQFALQFAVTLCVIAMCIVMIAYPLDASVDEPAASVVVAAPLSRESYDYACPSGKGITKNGICIVGDVIDNLEGKIILKCPADYPTITMNGCQATNGDMLKLTCPAGHVLGGPNGCFKQCPDGYNNKGGLCVNGDFKLAAPICKKGDALLDDKCYKPCPSGMVALKSNNKVCVAIP